MGDRAIIFLPMSIEAIVVMQACARLGITHSVVFGGFSAKALHERIDDLGAPLVICADGKRRGGRALPPLPPVQKAPTLGAAASAGEGTVWRSAGQMEGAWPWGTVPTSQVPPLTSCANDPWTMSEISSTENAMEPWARARKRGGSPGGKGTPIGCSR